MRYLTKSTLALTLLLVVACEPGDRQIAPEPDPTADTVPRGEVESFREQAETAMEETFRELEALGSRLAERTEEGWEELSERARETRAEIGAALDRASEGRTGEVHRSREDAARRLAELEGEMAARVVKAARSPEELTDVANERLDRLESDLAEMEGMVPPGTEVEGVDIDRDDLEDLREGLFELRQEVQEVVQAGPEELESQRDALGDEFEELTREIREHLYQLKWVRHGPARG